MGLLYLYLFLTAVGLTAGGSITIHIYTEYLNQNQNKKLWELRAVPRLCELYPGKCLTTEEKARENLS
jgi:hypothetical protein